MSMPIPACLVYKAARDEGDSRKRLQSRLDYNKKFGAFSTWPCSHQPPCEVPSDDQIADLMFAMPDSIKLFETCG